MRCVLWFSLALTACAETVRPTSSPVDAGQKKPVSDAGGEDAGVMDRPTPFDSGPVPARFQPLAEAIEMELGSISASGVAIAVVEGGAVTFARGFGTKHPDQTEPVLATTLFRIGSITKVLTALGVMSLVEEGRLAVDRPLADYTTGVEASWATTISVEHLLTHSSGLSDYVETDDDRELEPFLTGEFEQIVYPMAPPGRLFNYSNPNFSLAGLIIEQMGGEPYPEGLRRRVLGPLGMTRTFFFPAEVERDGDFAWGVSQTDAGDRWLISPSGYDNPWGRPTGFGFSSVLDLAELVAHLGSGARDAMAVSEPRVDRLDFGADHSFYGYGLFVDTGFFLPDGYRRLTLIRHGGHDSWLCCTTLVCAFSLFCFHQPGQR